MSDEPEDIRPTCITGSTIGVLPKTPLRGFDNADEAEAYFRKCGERHYWFVSSNMTFFVPAIKEVEKDEKESEMKV